MEYFLNRNIKKSFECIDQYKKELEKLRAIYIELGLTEAQINKFQSQVSRVNKHVDEIIELAVAGGRLKIIMGHMEDCHGLDEGVIDYGWAIASSEFDRMGYSWLNYDGVVKYDL